MPYLETKTVNVGGSDPEQSNQIVEGEDQSAAEPFLRESWLGETSRFNYGPIVVRR
jgi:hypothetical protein